LSTTYYTPYTSSTIASNPGQPTGTSILCLSCHDGTIAIGDVVSEQAPIVMLGGITTLPPGPSLLGTDLSDDHPISFAYDSILSSQRQDLVDPVVLTGDVKLDKSGQVQCTSCHDPHSDDNGKFLSVGNRGGALCLTCHGTFPFWAQSTHANSMATWNGMGIDPWPDTEWSTVAENACGNCHQQHSAGGPERLLKYGLEEQNCLPCHNATVAQTDLTTPFNKISRHPIEFSSGEHDPAEPTIIDTRHVECVDCHNPHAVVPSQAGDLGVLKGVTGISSAGIEVSAINKDFELCFRCHGDGYNKPPPRTPRQLDQQNLREAFLSNNPSYHPVGTTGTNMEVPSLLLPYTINSVMECRDCHDNDNSAALGGTGPRGPHGSNYAPILSMRYETADNTMESPSAYALCYSCHDRNSILADESFKSHRFHIVDQNTPCNTCHDPHGINYVQGTATNNSNLINFDLSIVSGNSLGEFRYESTGRFSGNCYLACHGSDHAPKSY
jgi:predicted CXXCH cytochrome family protein